MFYEIVIHHAGIDLPKPAVHATTRAAKYWLELRYSGSGEVESENVAFDIFSEARAAGFEVRETWFMED